MTDKPYQIQTSLGHRKYLCSGIYIPSVTTVLSATESEKSKAGLRTTTKQSRCTGRNNRGSAIHLVAKLSSRIRSGCARTISEFWNGISTYLDWFDVLTGLNDHFDRIGTTYVLTIEGGLRLEHKASTLDAPTSSVRSAVFQLLLTLKSRTPYCSIPRAW